MSAYGGPRGVRRQRRGDAPVRAQYAGRPSPVPSYPKGRSARAYVPPSPLRVPLPAPPTPSRSTAPPARDPQPAAATATAPFSGNSRPATYRSSAQLPLRPWHVRNQRFHPNRLGQRGVDPDEVQVFLDRVADDLHRVYAELAASRDENVRIKNALRQWQSQQAPHPRDLARQR
ncbi:DivIVA domain-containing protein [Micromonospora pisi]|uniref:DivIVA domain-containing protein n=1 Tax=Micromonospora pisi TaxID=589240 RepID=A0A495JKM0_9ACTN|nr:DivIVA domain-containing protein [Micromonospora pisi]